MSIIFFDNLIQNVVEKLVADHFLKSQNEDISQSKVFIVCQVEGNCNILKISCKPLAFTSYKTFLKNKKRSGTSLPPHFLKDF